MSLPANIARTGPRRVYDLERLRYPPQPWLTLHQCMADYSRERLIAKGKDCLRAWIGFNKLLEVIPPEQDVTAIQTGQIEDYTDLRIAQGANPLTVRRELVFLKAAINNAHRRNRIKLVPYIEVPEGHGAHRRPLTEEEYRLVLRQPMSGRLYRFYRVAYYTGHRSRAIEELTWDRVDFVRGKLDFNVPGRPITNKRRNGAFPIPDEFIETLRAWKAMAKDEFVIGAGSTTYTEAAYVVRELAGLKDPTLVPRHCMRKMFATVLFDRGANPEKVADLMKDKADTLRKHYVTFGETTMRETANLRARRDA